MSAKRGASGLCARFAGIALMAAVAGCGLAPGRQAWSGRLIRHSGPLTAITYIDPLPGDPGWDRNAACMTSEAARHGITVKVVGPPGGDVDTQQMENMLSQAVADRAQAIATWSAGAPAAFDALFALARAYGAVVATQLSPSWTGDQNFEVGLDVAKEARLEIQAVARRRGEQHVGIILQYSGGVEGSAAVAAVRSEARRHANVTLDAVEFDGGLFSNDVTIANAMLTAHPTINILVNYSGFPGLVTAIEERHLVGRVRAVISADFPRAVVGYIDAGLIAGVVDLDSCAYGRITVDRLIDAWYGRPVRRFYSAGSEVVSGTEFKRMVAQGAP